MREFNRVLVIQHIRSAKMISRSDISKQTGLSMSSLTTIISNLIDEGLVHEVCESTSRGGRRPIMLQFNGDYGYVVGIKIEVEGIYFSLSNLEADIEKKLFMKYPTQSFSNEQINQLLVKGITEVIKGCPADKKFVGIGIATSGLIDQENLLVIGSPIVGWTDYSFQGIAKIFKVPIHVENDANAFSFGNIWDFKGPKSRNFIGVLIGAGVGAGIVLDGRLYRGEDGGAGEIGHIVIQHEGTACYCGQRGCLEMYASYAFVVSEAKRMLAMHRPTALRELSSITPEGVWQAAKAGDLCSKEILFKQGENLGIGIRNIVNLMNPGAIVLGIETSGLEEYLLPGLEAQISTHFFAKHNHELEFKIRSNCVDVVLTGVSAAVISDLFRIPIYR